MKLKILKPILFNLLILTVLFSSCKEGEVDEDSLEWSDIKEWQEKRFPSGLSDDIRIRHNSDEMWVLVVINHNFESESEPDTTLIGPFNGHYPFPYDIESFKNAEDTDEDDEWVVEYLGPEGCCVQVYGKERGEIKLKKTYTIPGHNCQFTRVDSLAGEKALFFSNYSGDTVSVLRINFHTGDSIYFGSAPGDLKSLKDLEVVDEKTITIHHRNDTNYVTLRSKEGDIIDEIKMPGQFVKAKDDRQSSKIVITKLNNSINSRVLLLSETPISAGPDITQRGDLEDLQLHRINSQTYYIVSSYDASADITYISIIGKDGQGIANHSLKGKFFKAKKRPNDNKKVFITSEPANNDGSGKANIGIYDIATGVASNPVPPGVGGKPTGLDIDIDGNISIETKDVDDNTTNTNVVPN